MKKTPSKKTVPRQRAKRSMPFGPSIPVATEWARFGKRLALVLADMDEDDFLIITEKRRNVYVQFNAQGSFGILAEAVSNEYLTVDDRLSQAAIKSMRGMGWLPPQRKADDVDKGKKKAGGSPNFTLDCNVPVDFKRLADVVVRTLRTIYRTSHPAVLQYRAFGGGGDGFGGARYQIRFPTLGLKRGPE